MFPSFLDGTAPTTPPELLEPVRDAPKPDVDQSFETHLQRTHDGGQVKQDTAEAKTVGEDPDDTAGDGIVNAGQSTADESNQEESESVPAGTDPAHDAETHDDGSVSIEPNLTGELSIVDVDVSPQTDAASEVTPLENLAQTGLVEPVLEDETLPAAAFDDAADAEVATDSSDQSSSEELHHDVPLSERATAIEPVGNDVALPLEAANGSQNTTTSEGTTADPITTEAEAALASKSLSTGDIEPSPSGETVEGPQSERQNGNSATLKEGVAARQTPTAVDAALSPESEVKLEGTVEVDKSLMSSTSAEGKPDAAATSAQNRFAQQLIPGGGERNSRTATTDGINQTRFVDRVARAFRTTEGQGGTIKLRLHPPELGVLQVQLKVQGSVLTAKLEAETPAARALLVDSLPVLRERLAEQGIRIEQFDIDLMERHPQNLPDETGDRTGEERNTESSSPLEANDDAPSSGESRHVGGENQQLDIIV